MTKKVLSFVCAALVAMGCRASTPMPAKTAPPKTTKTSPPKTETERARQLLCGDIGHDTCLAECSEALEPKAHIECLLALRFGSDPEAFELARALHDEMKTLPGVELRRSVEGFHGQEVFLFPALPLGDKRHHLAWIQSSLKEFGEFLEAIAARAPQPVTFDSRPSGVAFFKTSYPSYPSAYCLDDVIAYNIDGPLHSNEKDMRETFFHELFHLNDARRGMWSERALSGIFESIVDKCMTDHACYAPFSPYETVVESGTYYAFDERTRNVREYAAELALRYFLEHERLLRGESLAETAFKCGAEENLFAWNELVDGFFGGLDLTPECSPP